MWKVFHGKNFGSEGHGGAVSLKSIGKNAHTDYRMRSTEDHLAALWLGAQSRRDTEVRSLCLCCEMCTFQDIDLGTDCRRQ